MEQHSPLLGDRYELLAPLASGGMGRVWRARDTLLERPVAVKVLRSEFTGDATFRARFRAEAQHTAALHHPNIASVFDYGEVQDGGEKLAFLVMELVEGETLSALLEREGRLDAARTLDMLRQASAALAAAHAAGVVHRDIKPGNVLVRTDGVVKITDFGIAWSASSVPLTGTGQVVGTAHYLSPEQAEGGKATPASDVYALGAVAYECLAGRRAFDGENSVQIALMQIREKPRPLPSDVPPEVRALVDRAMAKDPAVRFPDGAALRSAVDRAADGGVTAPIATAGPHGTAVLPVAASPSGVPGVPAREPEERRGWRVRWPLLLGVVVAAVVVAVILVVLRQTVSPPGSADDSPATDTSSTPAPPEVVAVVAGDLVGRPVEEVQAELEARDLQVQLAPVETSALPAGRVTAVSPTGDLLLGSVVTVSYAVSPLPAPAEPDNGDGQEGDGNRGEGDGERGEGGENGGEGGENGGEGGGNGNGNGNSNGNGNQGGREDGGGDGDDD